MHTFNKPTYSSLAISLYISSTLWFSVVLPTLSPMPRCRMSGVSTLVCRVSVRVEVKSNPIWLVIVLNTLSSPVGVLSTSSCAWSRNRCNSDAIFSVQKKILHWFQLLIFKICLHNLVYTSVHRCSHDYKLNHLMLSNNEHSYVA